MYDLPKGLSSGNIFKNIGNYVGTFVKTDQANITGGWKMYARIRVTLDLDKPLRRKMKIKREGGDWSWVQFKYERLSTFCFVCGVVGHSDREYGIVYANPDKEIARAYGVWLRAPPKNIKNQNLGAKWLRNGNGDGNAWGSEGSSSKRSTTVQRGGDSSARFMEVDGKISENLGDDGGLTCIDRAQGSNLRNNSLTSQIKNPMEGNFESGTTVIDTKRRCVEYIMDTSGEDSLNWPILHDGQNN